MVCFLSSFCCRRAASQFPITPQQQRRKCPGQIPFPLPQIKFRSMASGTASQSHRQPTGRSYILTKNSTPSGGMKTAMTRFRPHGIGRAKNTGPFCGIAATRYIILIIMSLASPTKKFCGADGILKKSRIQTAAGILRSHGEKLFCCRLFLISRASLNFTLAGENMAISG